MAVRDRRSPPSFGCGLLADLRDCRSNDPSRFLLKRHAATGNFPPALVGRRRGVPRARRRKATPVRAHWPARSISFGRKKGRNLTLLETAEGLSFGGVLDGVDAVRRGDGAGDGAQRTAGVGLGKAGVFVALALEEVRERVSAAWMNQQSTWPGLYPAMPILAPRPRKRDLLQAPTAHCKSCQDSCWKKSGARRGVAVAEFGEPKAPPGFPGGASSAGLSRHWVCGRGTR